MTYYIPSDLKEVKILEGCTSIGSGAFSYCSSLTSITIPSSVTLIRSWAFVFFDKNCCFLENVYYEGTIEEWCKISLSTEFSNPMIFASHFYMKDENNEYKEVTSIEIPETITSIRNFQFYGFNNVTSIVIPNSVTSIGRWAFSYCSSLEYNEYDNALYLGNEENPYLVLIEAKDISITSCKINDDTRFICDNAFSGCSSLTNIIIPDSITSIGEDAFHNCSSLEIVCYEGTMEDWCKIYFDDWDSNPMYYASYFYMKDENNEYKEVTSIKIPETITSIGDYQFCGFNNVISIVIPSSVTSIGSSAFSGCSFLTSIVFEDNSQLESIGSYAFYNCSSLTSITISSSITSIGYSAFLCCSSLENVYYEGTIEDWCNITFGNGYSNPMYYASHFYMKDENNEYKEVTSIEIPDTITSIGDYQFYGFSNVTSIVVLNSVTTIGANAFYGCSSLTIYCEAESQPSGWYSSWNPSNRPVVWGYKD